MQICLSVIYPADSFGNVFLPFCVKLVSFSYFFQLIKDKNNDFKSLNQCRLLLNFQLPWYSSVYGDSNFQIHM